MEPATQRMSADRMSAESGAGSSSVAGDGRDGGGRSREPRALFVRSFVRSLDGECTVQYTLAGIDLGDRVRCSLRPTDGRTQFSRTLSLAPFALSSVTICWGGG